MLLMSALSKLAALSILSVPRMCVSINLVAALVVFVVMRVGELYRMVHAYHLDLYKCQVGAWKTLKFRPVVVCIWVHSCSNNLHRFKQATVDWRADFASYVVCHNGHVSLCSMPAEPLSVVAQQLL